MKNTFLSLFRIALNKGDSVADYMGNSNGFLRCNVRFIRAIQHWEVGICLTFTANCTHYMECGGEDRLLWIHPENKNFLVRSLY